MAGHRERFVARVVITRVSEYEGTGRGDDRRYKATIANITVGDSDLESLKDKVAAHIALVDGSGGEVDV